MVHTVVQLLVLLLAIPAQYLISAWLNPNPSFTTVEILRLSESFQTFIKTWSQPDTWLTEINRIWFDLTSDQGECVAKEVFKHRSSDGHYANSVEPRSYRDAHVKYRVGQVIKHKYHNYHGVIVGWDPRAKAPKEFLKKQNGDDVEKYNRPHYKVMVDKKESTRVTIYIDQDNIEVVSNTEVDNNFLGGYFEYFDGTVYLPRPFLKELYPKD